MYFVVLTNGEQITGATTTWKDLVKRIKADSNLGIYQLGLTDMFHAVERLFGADSYYYFTDAEAGISNSLAAGGEKNIATPPKVIGEEIVGFYSPESTERMYRERIIEVDKFIVELKKRLDELRATNCSSQEIQDNVNMEIMQKQGIYDQMKFKKQRLQDEMKAAMDAGGTFICKRLDLSTVRMPINIGPEEYARINSRILHQDQKDWSGPKPNLGGDHGTN
jgi:hypothetical protein